MNISTQNPVKRDHTKKLSTLSRGAAFAAAVRERLDPQLGADGTDVTSRACREVVDTESGEPCESKESSDGGAEGRAKGRLARFIGLAGSRVHFDQRTRGMLAVLMLVIAIAAAVTAWFAWPSPESVPKTVPVSEEDDDKKDEAKHASKLAVSVAGDVAKPGLVEVSSGDRVADAIDAAGGVSPEDADAGYLNLARQVRDGEMIVVEADGEGEDDSDPDDSGGGADGTGDDSATESDGGGGAGANEPVNLNEATEQELTSVPGVGPVTAANIVAFREQHGGFDSVDQLAEVDRIGPATVDKMQDSVTV